VLRLPIQEFSAKVRQGPPLDDAEDYSLPTWAGVLPLELKAGEPLSDPKLGARRELPQYVKNYRRHR